MEFRDVEYEELYKWFSALKSQDKEYKKGAVDALQKIIDVGLRGFGGDATDFAEWLDSYLKESV